MPKFVIEAFAKPKKIALGVRQALGRKLEIARLNNRVDREVGALLGESRLVGPET